MILIGDNLTTKLIDNRIINNYCISNEVLIENVAHKLLEHINLNYETYFIIAGIGNNGADAYALARLLYIYGKDVIIYKVDDSINSKFCLKNYEICKKLNIPIIKSFEKFEYYLQNCDVLIDGIFGIGLNLNINEYYTMLIDKINYYKTFKKFTIYSIDIPSGIESKFGMPCNNAIIADCTLSILTYKKAFLNLENEKYWGEVIIIKDIGIPYHLLMDTSNDYLIEKDDLKELKKERKNLSNKTNYGKNYIIASSQKYIGAGYLAAKASIKCGCGYTYLLSEYNKIASVVYEIPELIYTNDYSEILNADSIAIGPGIEYNYKIKEIIENLKDKYKIVVDASAINPKISYNSKNIILTPHTGEFEKISTYTLNEIIKDPLECVRNYTFENNTNLLLKGKNTIISNGKYNYVINTGNPYMANAGMGDVLTGMISSFISQKYSIEEASIISSYLHGYIADKLSNSQYIINPSDIIDNINKYLNELF